MQRHRKCAAFEVLICAKQTVHESHDILQASLQKWREFYGEVQRHRKCAAFEVLICAKQTVHESHDILQASLQNTNYSAIISL